ncbi:endonuclease/exonuclease/phosphatase family protein [Niabella beijingensis]|uniref:endonuclease/exonuclease/phosphatase family protein n=1 Tax=Niabella beijingensis TaxID=2872700 RepID=UPI001CBC33B8|nr:endonuclease/exonuclease/phosphatase family protein [Niabella beijingensis]MBZ4187971.1 endonuclease/exonuclease/phosphatase family protein [Niabella beijingensis]
MNKHIFLALIFLLAGIYVNRSNAQTVKVLTYNIYHGEEHYNNGKSNLEKIAAVIRKYQPDFVAMQEVDSMTKRTATFNNGVKKDLVAELAKMTGMHGYFGKAMDYNEGGYGEGLLSKYAAVPVVHQLPVPAGGEGRALITIEHQFANGKKMVFAGTHLCHEFETNREAQAKAVADILLQMKLPVAVGGDFNITPDTKAYAIISGRMEDAAVRFGNPQLTFPYTKPRIRLDYIFLNKGAAWKVKKVEVIDKEDASDHKPVLVTLELM